MICPSCGFENRAEARFCRNCGSGLVPPPERACSTTGEPKVRPEAQACPSAMPSITPAINVAPMSEPLLVEHNDRDETGPSSAPGVRPAAEAEPGPAPEPWVSADAAEAPASTPEIETEHIRLEPGTVLADRYTIVQVLSESETAIVYQARDVQRCPDPACGFVGNEADAVFCANCGRELTERGLVTLTALAEEGANEAASRAGAETFTWHGARYTVLPDAAPPAPSAHFSSGVTLRVGYGTDTGHERELNEDSLFVLSTVSLFNNTSGPVVGLFILADGIGGSDAGEIASRLAVQVVADHLIGRVVAPLLGGSRLEEAELRAWVSEAVQAANAEVHQLATAKQNDMGTTLTLALLVDDAALVANVGDSRTYLLQEGKLQLLTRDHSIVARRVAEGTLKADEIYTHPERNLIYRSLGAQDQEASELFPIEGGMLELLPGARLVLCSDGLWEMLRDAELEEVLWREPDPQRACNELVRLANVAGGQDNISAIVVNVEE